MEAYAVLRHFGHSPQKAQEIILDAKRGDIHSQLWIALLHQQYERDDTNKTFPAVKRAS